MARTLSLYNFSRPIVITIAFVAFVMIVSSFRSSGHIARNLMLNDFQVPPMIVDGYFFTLISCKYCSSRAC